MLTISRISSVFSVLFMPATGSSSSSSVGSVASARAISSLRCAPYDRLSARSSALWSSFIHDSSSRARSRARFSAARYVGSANSRPGTP